MLKGALVAFAIMLASIPIPIVHFVALPISPFVAGFIGGGVANADESRITWFGLLVGGLMILPAIPLAIWAALSDGDVLFLPAGLVLVIAIAIPFYAWFGVTVGALLSYLMRRKERESTTNDATV